ncbi:hypothetical protein P775_05245 [Puniceibacterium antarcticum]|uniref:DUF4410 domain-containing protein n=1 Tax=Puniceibacterium antarcticum TaxID=1206336 RepID=A0A2G8RI65_9RHOB|nr:hypothetical protein [Puniceibacterium antarcticum]PIL21202.1 hypothetical protein P775_05245 [Puniceibacterium antarcticum]
MSRLLLCLVLALGLSACADGARNLKKPVEPIGNFKLGHAIVVAPNIVEGPASRDATADDWIAGVDAALEQRFRRYEGDKFYHLGVSVEGFVLAVPGVPLVFNPKSVVIVKVTVFDDAARGKMNDTPEQITALEAVSGKTIIGSGVTQSKEEQMKLLSDNVALQIENWMRKMQREEGWFGGPDAGVPIAAATAEAPTVAEPVAEPVVAAPVAAQPAAAPAKPEGHVVMDATVPFSPVIEAEPAPVLR